MPNGEDWLMRPVLRGLIRYESLVNGSVDLLDVQICNDALDCADENDWRVAEARKT